MLALSHGETSGVFQSNGMWLYAGDNKIALEASAGSDKGTSFLGCYDADGKLKALMGVAAGSGRAVVEDGQGASNVLTPARPIR
jgi:hypothetical protein